MSRKDVPDRLVCLAYLEYRGMYLRGENAKWPYEFLSKWTGEPNKVCYRAMERACDRGYIEYGVSLRSGWVTKKGLELVAEGTVL